jgi:hypothetical protein
MTGDGANRNTAYSCCHTVLLRNLEAVPLGFSVRDQAFLACDTGLTPLRPKVGAKNAKYTVQVKELLLALAPAMQAATKY